MKKIDGYLSTLGLSDDPAQVNCKRCRGEVKRPSFEGIVNPFKIGDILYNSWGYDQTNIDYYQVIKITPKGIVIREISKQGVDGTQGFMSENCVASKDHFVGPAIAKRLYPASWNPIGVRVPMDHGSLTLWDGRPLNRSWYA